MDQSTDWTSCDELCEASSTNTNLTNTMTWISFDSHDFVQMWLPIHVVRPVGIRVNQIPWTTRERQTGMETGIQRICRHDDAIGWKYFPRYWPFLRGIHRSLVDSPHKGITICWANNRDAGDLRRHHAHYDVTVIERTQQRHIRE